MEASTEENNIAFVEDEIQLHSKEMGKISHALVAEMNSYTNIIASIAIILVSTATNALILAIYRKRKNEMNNKFVMTLACLDIATCWINRPLDVTMGFLDLESNPVASLAVNRVYDVAFAVTSNIYSLVLFVWSLERLLAVAFPFTFQEKLRRLRVGCGLLALVNLANSVTASFTLGTNYFGASFKAVIGGLVKFFSISKVLGSVAAYSAIVTLIKRNDAEMSAKMGVGGEARQAVQSRSHMRSVKICVCLFLVYIVSYVPLFLVLNGVVSRPEVPLLYYVNHVANFFVYYVTDEKFRDDVRALCCAKN